MIQKPIVQRESAQYLRRSYLLPDVLWRILGALTKKFGGISRRILGALKIKFMWRWV